MTELFPFQYILTSATPPRCHTPLDFFCQFLRGVNVNYHAKFGGPSLKNDLVMLILIYTHKCHAPQVPPEIILTLLDLPDLPDWQYLYQSISRKGKVNFNGFPIFPINWVHIYQSISDTEQTYLNEYPIYLLLRAGKNS